MKIEMKAKELGEMIANTDEMLNLKAAEAELESDDRAKQLLEDYNVLQMELAKALRGGVSEGSVEEIKKMFQMKHEEVKDYRVTRSFLAAKAAFDILMKKLNDIILFAITGEEAEHCSSHKCGSCDCGCE